jgi:hypothetical protein
MATITNLRCLDERGRPVPCDAHGHNVAFVCPRCSHPMLAIARRHQRGSGPDNPATCRKCAFECWIEAHADGLRLYRRTLS